MDRSVHGISNPRCWGFSPRDGKQQGRLCHYCVQVYASRFKTGGQSVQQWLADLGADSSKMDRFNAYLKALVDVYIAKGGRGAVVSWADIDTKTTSHLAQKRTRVCEADDQLWGLRLLCLCQRRPEAEWVGAQRDVGPW